MMGVLLAVFKHGVYIFLRMSDLILVFDILLLSSSDWLRAGRYGFYAIQSPLVVGFLFSFFFFSFCFGR